MNKWKIAFIIAIVLLIGTNLFWLYNTVDDAITIDYHQVEMGYQKKTIDALGSLIVQGSKQYNPKDILHLIRQADPKAFIVEEGNSIKYEGAEFKFEGDTLISVSRNN